MKKKVSIFIYSLAGGGAERVVSTLLYELREFYDITLVLMNNTIDYSIPNEQKIVFLSNSNPNENGIFKFVKIPFLAYKYGRYCATSKIDISFSFMNRPNYINALSKFFGNRSKIIISERIYTSMEYHSNSLKDHLSRVLIKWLYPKADLIVPNALAIKRDLEQKFHIHTKFAVINNPFDINKITQPREDNIDFNYNGFVFINVARLQSQKNHELLIKAFSQLKHEAQLIILGEGALLESLQILINSLDLNNKIHLLGFKSNVYQFLTRADCFILSSNYEGFPNVLVEAMACELPVIATDCLSGPREILAPNSNQDMCLKHDIELGQYGILTPINDIHNLEKAMNTIITNENLRDSYKIKSRQRAQDFSKEKIILQFIKAIEYISNETKGIQCVE